MKAVPVPRKLLIAFLLGVTSCSPTAPDTASVALEGNATVLMVDSVQQSLHAQLSFTIRNVGSVNISYLPCNNRVQRESGGEWITVWSTFCLLSGSNAVDLPPGSERTHTWPVDLAASELGGSFEPALRIGTYIFWRPGEGDWETTPTFTFTLP